VSTITILIEKRRIIWLDSVRLAVRLIMLQSSQVNDLKAGDRSDMGLPEPVNKRNESEMMNWMVEV